MIKLTKNQYKLETGKDKNIISKILSEVKPDGLNKNGYSEYSLKSFVDAILEYNSKNGTLGKTSEDDVRRERHRTLKLHNDQKEKLLMNRERVHDLYKFLTQIFVMELKDLLLEDTKRYTEIVDRLYTKLDCYLLYDEKELPREDIIQTFNHEAYKNREYVENIKKEIVI